MLNAGYKTASCCGSRLKVRLGSTEINLGPRYLGVSLLPLRQARLTCGEAVNTILLQQECCAARACSALTVLLLTPATLGYHACLPRLPLSNTKGLGQGEVESNVLCAGPEPLPWWHCVELAPLATVVCAAVR